MATILVFSCGIRAALLKKAIPLLLFSFWSSDALAAETEVLPERAEHLARLTIELIEGDSAARAKKVTEIDAAPQCGAREDERRLAVEFWAISDAAAALQYVQRSSQPLRTKQGLLEAVTRGWTRSSPEDAWSWSVQQPIGDQLDLPRAALETVATTEADKGFAWLKSRATAQPPRSDSDFSEHAFAFFTKLCDIGDYAAVRRLIDQLPAGDLRERLLFFSTERMARYALADAAAWALARAAQPDAYFPQAAVALEKVRRDFDEAFAWVLAIENPANRAQLARTIAGDVVAREPTVASTERILAKLSADPERQAAYAAFATTSELVQASPVLIMDYAWTIAATQDRRMALIRGYSYWHAVDKDAALSHLARAARGHENDRKVIERFLSQPDEP